MKKVYLFSLLNMLLLSVIAQVPQGINYQAVARNANGAVLANTQISCRFTVLNGINPGTPEYAETDTATTNAFGLFTHVIGQGSAVSGTFSGITWSAGDKYLRVELDVTGGTNFVNMGTSQMVSVPYALYAATAGNAGATGAAGSQGPTGAAGATGTDGATGATGTVGATGADGATGATGLLLPGTAAGNTPYWDGSQWVTNSSNIYNNGANIGIGTNNPSVKLDIESGNVSPALKLADGTQAAGSVLTSDSRGNARWQAPSTFSKPVFLRGSIASFSSDSLIFSLPNDSVNVYYSPLTGLVTVYNVTGSYYYDVCITGVQNGGQVTPVAVTGSPAAGQWTNLALGAGGANGNYGVSVIANHEAGAHGFVLNFTIFEDGINCLVHGIVQYY